MKIITDQKLIKRNSRIGQFATIGALVVLAVGMYISFTRTDLFFWSITSLVVGFAMTQVGMFFSNRWGRSPRPDEQLDAGLKGLPNEDAIYHYVTPASHLYAGAAGLWVLLPLHQHGRARYEKQRWKISGGGFMQGYLSIFGQEGLGRPELEIESEIDAVKKYLTRKLDDESVLPEIYGALVFTNDLVELSQNDAPRPALKIKQLKDFMRRTAKQKPIAPEVLERIRSVLPDEE